MSYWMTLGLYQGMKQEHLKDQDRQQFNQGINRSLRNGLLLSLISAIIVSTIGVLGTGLSADMCAPSHLTSSGTLKASRFHSLLRTSSLCESSRHV
jgi:hypothetical protein